MNIKEKVINALNHSHSEFQSIDQMSKILLQNGFKELNEIENFELENNGKYFVKRNLTSLIAFKTPNSLDDLYFKIVASHPDSPAYKIKSDPVININGYEKLKVEGYGGMIISTWLDKPLGIAGRIVVRKDNNIYSKLVDSNGDTCIIPNVAIHQNRNINSGYQYNNQVDLCPIIGDSLEEGSNYNNLIKSFLDKDEVFLSEDLYLYNREEAKEIGFKKDYISSPKLDDLAAGFSSLLGFIESEDTSGINVFASLNNEEVGSESINGADSTFLRDILRRITLYFKDDKEAYYKAIAKSFLVSADNAHAIHPNHPELSDDKNKCLLNGGIVIKHNANMLYTSDALSTSFIKTLCEKENLKIQEFFNRSDVRGGSTLGNISNSHVSLLSVDIGLPQLAMHSNYEVMGSKDLDEMYKLIKKFMSVSFELNKTSVKIK